MMQQPDDDLQRPSPETSVPRMEPVAAPQASRSETGSGDRGTGGGLGDALGGARTATAAEMLGADRPIGDVSIQIPRSGSATEGGAIGAGLSRAPGGLPSPGAVDPGGDAALTGSDDAQRESGGDRPVPGETRTAGGLDDLDAAFRRRDGDATHEG